MKKIAALAVCLLIPALSMAMARPSAVIKEKITSKSVLVTTDEFVPDQIVVKFKPASSETEIESKITDEGDSKVYESSYKKLKILKIPPGTSLKQAISRYRGDKRVEYVKRNYLMKATMVPTDPYYSLQWNFSNSTSGGINMPAAWDKSTGQGVIVAVVDTGVAYENYGTSYAQAPDLAGVSFIPGWDFINNDAHPNDDEGHGTHVTGTIAQSTNNGIGVAGIAFSASIMPVKVLDKNGSGSYVQVADGIRYATDHGAKIINMSLGGSLPDTYLEDAVRYAYNHGVTVVAASGNDGLNSVSYPAAYDAYVIAVGATTSLKQKASYSNSGSALDITAPGGDTIDHNGDGYIDGILQQTFTPPKFKVFGYYFYTGTSMATPHVSGVAALILARNSTFTPDQVRNFIQSTAEDLGPPGWDADFGWGKVDANAAVPNISISLSSDGVVTFGSLALGSTTSTLPGSEESVLIDAGPADLSIRSSDFTDSSNHWLLANSAAQDSVKWEYSSNNSNWNTFLAPATDYPLAAGLSGGTTQPVYFRLTMPTNTISSLQHSSAVTIIATSP